MREIMNTVVPGKNKISMEISKLPDVTTNGRNEEKYKNTVKNVLNTFDSMAYYEADFPVLHPFIQENWGSAGREQIDNLELRGVNKKIIFGDYCLKTKKHTKKYTVTYQQLVYQYIGIYVDEGFVMTEEFINDSIRGAVKSPQYKIGLYLNGMTFESAGMGRSEERRVGKEGRWWWWGCREKEKWRSE